jgi:hypothetical protein
VELCPWLPSTSRVPISGILCLFLEFPVKRLKLTGITQL